MIMISFIGLSQTIQFTRQDSLRGSITPERSWWDLAYYHLDIRVHPEAQSIDRQLEGSAKPGGGRRGGTSPRDIRTNRRGWTQGHSPGAPFSRKRRGGDGGRHPGAPDRAQI